MTNKPQIKLQSRNIFSRAPFSFKASEYFDTEVATDPMVGPIVSEIPIFPVGEFKQHHDIPDGFKITPETIQGFVDTFEKGVAGNELPVYPGHGDGYTDRQAVGWVKSLINRGDKGLWGVVEWTQEGVRLIRDKAFKYISPEWLFEYTDPRNGESYTNVLFAPALVNEPYFQMPAITASNKSNINIYQNTMDTKTILQKPVAELTEEEKTFLREHKDEINQDELNDEQKTALAAVIADEKPADEGKEADKVEAKAGDNAADAIDSAGDEDEDIEKKEDGEESDEESDEAGDDAAGAGDDKGEKAVEGEGKDAKEADADVEVVSEGDRATASANGSMPKRIKASELRQLQQDSAELAKTRIVASIEKAKVLPAIKDAAIDFAMKLSEPMRVEFVGLLEKAKAGIKTERITSSEKEGVKKYESASAELEARAEAHAAEHKTTLDKAINHIGQEDPTLLKRVDAERSGE